MSRRKPLREEEPFATIRAHPRRFGWGIPMVFAFSLGAAIPLAESNLSLAVALQLFIQTAGLLLLYVPPARRRWRARSQGTADPVSDEGEDGGEPRP